MLADTLFEEKWRKYARYWYWAMRALDVFYFVMLIVLAFGLKFYPPTYILYRVIPSMMLSFAAPIFFLEFRTAVLWLTNFRNRPERQSPLDDENQTLASGIIERVAKASVVVDPIHKHRMSPPRVSPHEQLGGDAQISSPEVEERKRSAGGTATFKAISAFGGKELKNASQAGETIDDTFQTVEKTAEAVGEPVSGALGVRDGVRDDDELQTIETKISVYDAFMPLWQWIREHQIHWKVVSKAVPLGLAAAITSLPCHMYMFESLRSADWDGSRCGRVYRHAFLG